MYTYRGPLVNNHYQFRRSPRRCSARKGVLINFAKLTGKNLRQSLFFNKVAGLKPTTLLKKKILVQVFSCKFCKIYKNTFFIEHVRTTASISYSYPILLRSSRLQRFFEIGVRKNFAILTGKHLCWCLFLIKLQAVRPTTLLKRDSNTDVFLRILGNF